MSGNKSGLGEMAADSNDIEQAANSLKAMAHPLRLSILCNIGSLEMSVQDIVEAVGTSQSNISQHLGVLKAKGIVISTKEANKVFYRIKDERTIKLLLTMREIFCQTQQNSDNMAKKL